MSDILVVGSLNMDLVVVTERMPGGGETLHGEEFHMIPGGKGANQAAAIGRLGGSVSMIGKVGSDSFAPVLRGALAADHVDVRFVLTEEGSPTGVALIVVEKSGENRIIVVAGANRKLTCEDLSAAEALFAQAKVVVAQFEVPLEVVEKAADLAHYHAAQMVVNAAPAYPITDKLMSKIDTLVVNEHEAGILSGVVVDGVESAGKAAQALIRRGAKAVVLTLGPIGSLVCTETEGPQHVPTFEMRVVDTTAAGDAFIGGLAVSLVEAGGTLAEKVRFANAAGAMATTRLGAQSSLPTRAEVEALLASRKDGK